MLGNLKYCLVPNLYGPYQEEDSKDYKKCFSEYNDLSFFHEHPHVMLRGQDVIIGIIDSGINYTHPAFIYEDNTSKIISIWDQTIQGNPPDEFEYGTEFTRDEIDQALKSENPFSIVPTKDKSGHGTFLAGVAAGKEIIKNNVNFIGVAPDSELIVVKLKEAKKYLKDFYLIDDSSVPAYQNTDLMMAVKYLTKQAQKYAGKQLVICIGIGSNQGGHDGSSTSEIYLSQVGAKEGNVVVVAAGNEAPTQRHYSVEFSKDEQEKEMKIDVGEGVKGFTLNIWNFYPDLMPISIISPTNEFIAQIPFKIKCEQEEKYTLILEETEIYIKYEMFEMLSGNQLYSIRFKNPTEGNWKIILYGDLIVNRNVHAFITRNGWVEGVQFSSPNPDSTITEPSTAEGVLTVGAYKLKDKSLVASSGRGYTRNQHVKPEIVAPGFDVCGPSSNNGFKKMTGTSVSAAITAGASALLLEWGKKNDIYMNTQTIKNFFIIGADRIYIQKYPDRQWGYGQLNLKGFFDKLGKIIVRD
ncbi:S8 family peptidase [Romboutsia sp.]|uniref:S8 family peptidase n=1 Tax=Romboutsia sp. TaxID=1965302 RepID=UPI002BF2EB25|nr:S8 family peptidase [Romboutsia sp.]HSQ87813.1 S8 family peptidase [Romboutsia sp.]